MTVVVVGGGAAGLVAARDLARAGRHVVVVEATDVVGGALRGHDVAGLRLDAGAESFATRTDAVAGLAAELGLEVVAPSGARAWVHSAAGSVPLPATGLLGVPARPWAADVRRAVGLAGALRASVDRVLPRRVGLPDGPVSLGALVRVRMGRRVVDRLVTPVVAGVHSTPVDRLDLGAVPGLRDAVVRHGSLAAAVGALRAAAPAGSAVAGIRGGVHRLAEALADDVVAHGGAVLTGTAAEALRLADGGWEVATRSGDVRATLPADAVVVATDAGSARRLLVPVVTGPVPEVPAQNRVDLVTLVLDAPALDRAPRGTGVLVAPGTAGVRAKALTHATAKWPWLAQVSDGRHVVRLSYGSAVGDDGRPGTGPDHGPTSSGAGSGPGVTSGALDDAVTDAIRIALADAATLLGTPLEAAQVLGAARVTWRSGLPPRHPGLAAEVERFRAEVATVPGLAVVGAWVAGTGLAAVVPDARRAAGSLTRH